MISVGVDNNNDDYGDYDYVDNDDNNDDDDNGGDDDDVPWWYMIMIGSKRRC